MKENIRVSDHLDAALSSEQAAFERLPIKGRIRLTCYDPFGREKWTEDVTNLITNEGKDHVLDVALSGGTQITTWYVLLISGSSPTLASSDTMSSHSGWTEFTSYDETTRPTWTDGGVSSQSVDNSASPATYTINASGTIGAAAMTSDNTKGGTTGTLFAEGALSTARTVDAGDTVNVTYTINA